MLVCATNCYFKTCNVVQGSGKDGLLPPMALATHYPWGLVSNPPCDHELLCSTWMVREVFASSLDFLSRNSEPSSMRSGSCLHEDSPAANWELSSHVTYFRPLEDPMPPWRRKIVTASANCAGFVLLMLGFRIRVKGWQNVANAKQLGAVWSATCALCALCKACSPDSMHNGRSKPHVVLFSDWPLQSQQLGGCRVDNVPLCTERSVQREQCAFAADWHMHTLLPEHLCIEGQHRRGEAQGGNRKRVRQDCKAVRLGFAVRVDMCTNHIC